MGTDSVPTFGDLLRRARREAGFTQEALAEHAGISVRAIADLERGINRAPRRDTLDMLMDALDLPADERRRWKQLQRLTALAGRKPGVNTRDTPAAHPNNLPLQPTQFFGRADELSSLTRVLQEPGNRLVTLTGLGGSGKTRLAIELAASLSGEYPDGVFFVDLAPVSDPGLVLSTIGTTLGIRPRGDQPLSTTLVNRLAGKRLLLVLDNFEQVLAAAPSIGELLAGCSDLRLLVTSRAPLHLRAEREYPVPPFPLPPVDDTVPASSVADYDAVRLFIDRARAVRPGFDAVGDEALTVARIGRQLDGLPLAIELAAACIRLLPPAVILTRLNHHLPLPAGGHRDSPARQRTLRDTIAWSYDVLQPNERTLMRRLSVFKGGWTLDPADAVAGGEATDAPVDVLNGLETLAEHNLIQSYEWHDGSPRFTMFETIREFGLERLDAHQERHKTHRRHAMYFLQMFSGSEADWDWDSPRVQALLQQGDAEIENLRLALEWAMAHEPETALRLAQEVAWYWFARGTYLEAQRWLEQALASAVDAPAEQRAGALYWVGAHATTRGDFETARVAHEQGLALYQRLGDDAGAAECLHGLARNAMWAGDLERAESLYEEVADRYRLLELPGLPSILGNLGSVLLRLDKLDRAATVLDEALAQAERHGLIRARADILGLQASLAVYSDDLVRARQLTKSSLLIFREVGDPRYIAQTIEIRAWLAIAEGAAELAARLLEAVDVLRDTIGAPVQPLDQLDYDRFVPIAKAQIGDDEWDHARALGRGLSPSDAIDMALQGLE